MQRLPTSPSTRRYAPWVVVVLSLLASLLNLQETRAQDTAITTVTVARPAPGESGHYAARPGMTFVLDFDPQEAQAELVDADLLLTFSDGARIVLEGLADAARSNDPPVLQMNGTDIPSEMLIDSLRALADGSLEPAGGLAQPAAAVMRRSLQLEFTFTPFPEIRRARLQQ